MTSTVLLKTLRKRHDEVQLTQSLAAFCQADPKFASAFVSAVTSHRPEVASRLPSEMQCTTEEAIDEGRVDLRFRSKDEWDVVVEIKLFAGYGSAQIERDLCSLAPPLTNAYVVAATRDAVLYGEDVVDPRWLGSVRWRHIRKQLRLIPHSNDELARQWPLWLDVLDEEGSMGFTKPQPGFVANLAMLRASARHVEEFLIALQQPLLDRLRRAFGDGDSAADYWRSQGGKGRPIISKSWSGVIDLHFRVPANGPRGVRAGLFARNPPVRFYVAPQYGRGLSAKRSRLDADSLARLQTLGAAGFRDADLHAFIGLTPELLARPTLEEDVADWAGSRFDDLAISV